MSHLYTKKDEALFDLRLFSNMNANEGKTLYLRKTKDNKLAISNVVFHDDVIEAIAVNGKVFQPTE
jgi:hypothetical protein